MIFTSGLPDNYNFYLIIFIPIVMKYFFTLIVIFSMISCGGDDPIDPINYDEQNEQEIQDYIAKNNLNATRSNTGLYYVIETEGTGNQPNANSDVTVNYKGYYINENIFDQNDNISFNLQQVISGWTEGITYFKEGGSGILLIPSRLGYGYEDYNGIPGGSVLIFDIDLLKVE